jgi:hypothetical protein
MLFKVLSDHLADYLGWGPILKGTQFLECFFLHRIDKNC